MNFVLVDETQGATTANGQSLTGAILSQIASAAQLQLNRDVAPEHGGGSHLVRVGSSTDLHPGETVFAILAALPDAPGAVAYHAVDGSGLPTAFDAITASDTLTGPGNSLSVAITHELCEIVGDEGCDLWADRGDGYEVAHELCDAVEAFSYDVGSNGVYVTDFVLRAFFDPSHAGPYDFMSANLKPDSPTVPGPMQAAPSGGGDYQIVRNAGTGEGQVTAEGNLNGRRSWRHGSRRARRGLTV